MLSRRGFAVRPPPSTAADSDDFGSCVGVGPAAAAAAASAGSGLLAGSFFVPGLAMFPLQLAFIPSVPRTHLSTIAGAFFLDTNPNLHKSGQRQHKNQAVRVSIEHRAETNAQPENVSRCCGKRILLCLLPERLEHFRAPTPSPDALCEVVKIYLAQKGCI